MHQYVASLVVIAFVLSLGCPSAAGQSPLEITTQRETDRAEVRVKGDKAILSLHSPTGISQAVIRRTDEKWPDQLILHLHLRGLEHLKVTNSKVTLEAAVSSHDATQPVRQWKDGDEKSPLVAKSPYWLEFRRIDNEGKPTTTIPIPIEDGYFEIRLPQALFEENPKSVTVSWIDFYR